MLSLFMIFFERYCVKSLPTKATWVSLCVTTVVANKIPSPWKWLVADITEKNLPSSVSSFMIQDFRSSLSYEVTVSTWPDLRAFLFMELTLMFTPITPVSKGCFTKVASEGTSTVHAPWINIGAGYHIPGFWRVTPNACYEGISTLVLWKIPLRLNTRMLRSG